MTSRGNRIVCFIVENGDILGYWYGPANLVGIEINGPGKKSIGGSYRIGGYEMPRIRVDRPFTRKC